MSADTSSLRERIHNFFEEPDTPAAYAVQIFIAVLILASVGTLIIEFWYPIIFANHETLFHFANSFVLFVFTVEYVLRVGTARKKIDFALKPYSLIDFFAVFPNYLELLLPLAIDSTALRVLRLARILRLLKFLRYGSIFNKVLRFQGTILQNITPVILLFVGLKGVIWFFESQGLWFKDAQLGDLFTIIGFALGIILSQKINVSYEKFIQVEEAAVRIRSMLDSMESIFNKHESGLGAVCREWGRIFLKQLKNPGGIQNAVGMDVANASLHNAVLKIEDAPNELTIFYTNLMNEAQFCLSKKARLIPKPYDTLLHQSTMLYLALVAVFIPGVTGLISTILATYILYGMYNLTQDFDTIIGGEFDLINIDISELEEFVSK